MLSGTGVCLVNLKTLLRKIFFDDYQDYSASVCWMSGACAFLVESEMDRRSTAGVVGGYNCIVSYIIILF